MAKCSKCSRKRNKKASATPPPQPKMYYANSTGESSTVSVGLKEDIYINDKFFRVGSTVNLKQMDAFKLLGSGAPIWIR